MFLKPKNTPSFQLHLQYTKTFYWGRGNSIMVSVSVCEVGLSRLKPSSIRISQKGGDPPACYQLVPTSADDLFNKGGPCVIMSVIMHVEDSQLSVVRVGHCVLLVGFCLSLYILHVLNRDINMIQTIYLKCFGKNFTSKFDIK